ncbi:MAG: hypothetical protein JWR55_1968 [Aeromicrobium sp.]|nr:hypothetical protein [Aeromicrobium sp.]
MSAAVVAALFVATGTDHAAVRADAAPETATTQVRTPADPLVILPATSTAASAAAMSRQLFTSSPVAVLSAADDREAQRRAIAAATTLGVPVLVDGDEAPAELERLGASTVLTVGATRTVQGGVAELRGTVEPGSPRTTDAIVVTRSVTADAVAVATARIAGAHVVEMPGADPRTDPDAARYLAEHPASPVIAIGPAFAQLAYPLDVVRTNAQQPTGGYLALGKHYTAMYGHPGAPQLGVLGEQGVRASVARVERLARKYRRVTTSADFVPTFEIIATVASASAGKDGNYSTETPAKDLLPLVDAAEKAGVYVILDLQPGRSDFLSQAKKYRSLLERPHVGLALDPEWRLTRKQKHLVQIGSVSAAEINRTSTWLADLTRDASLPQKIFVLHQFSSSMIKHRGRIDTSRPEFATVIHVDGSGPQGAKQETWGTLRRHASDGVGWGWKNFVDEDDPMLDARQTWRRVSPHPALITYQ